MSAEFQARYLEDGRGWVIDQISPSGASSQLLGVFVSREAAETWISVQSASFLKSQARTRVSVIARNNVHVRGNGTKSIILAHGFGCDQSMWRFVAPELERTAKVVLFDHVGSGNSDLSAYTTSKYSSLSGYADDVVDIVKALDLKDATFVGHSVSAMIGVLASLASPGIFGQLILVAPSARYIDDIGYVGGFSKEQIDQLLSFVETNYVDWARSTAPLIMGNADRPQLGVELADSFCRMDAEVAKEFARVTFTSDTRSALSNVATPSLILQCRDDFIASEAVGQFVHEAISKSRMKLLDAVGHCPHLSAPEEVAAAIAAFARGDI